MLHICEYFKSKWYRAKRSSIKIFMGCAALVYVVFSLSFFTVTVSRELKSKLGTEFNTFSRQSKLFVCFNIREKISRGKIKYVESIEMLIVIIQGDSLITINIQNGDIWLKISRVYPKLYFIPTSVFVHIWSYATSKSLHSLLS